MYLYFQITKKKTLYSFAHFNYNNKNSSANNRLYLFSQKNFLLPLPPEKASCFLHCAEKLIILKFKNMFIFYLHNFATYYAKKLDNY